MLGVTILSMSISVPESIGSGPGARDVVPATLPVKSLINKKQEPDKARERARSKLIINH